MLLSRIFRKYCFEKECFDAPKICYLQPILYEIQNNQEFKMCKYLYGEPLLNHDDKWEKYMNNFSSCNNDLYSAFSHFTFIASDQELVVTDL